MKTQKFFTSTTNTFGVDYAILVLRLAAAGFMIYGHGWGKFLKFIGEDKIEFMDPFGLGHAATFFMVMFAEFICSILVFIGLFTRIALIPLIFTMAYVVFVVHISDEFGKIELPAFYLAAYIALFLLGPGKHSLDRIIGKSKKTI